MTLASCRDGFLLITTAPRDETAQSVDADRRCGRRGVTAWCSCMCYIGCSVEKYQEQFFFLRDSRFLQDLENDSVDSDLIEEELRALRESAIRFQLFSSSFITTVQFIRYYVAHALLYLSVLTSCMLMLSMCNRWSCFCDKNEVIKLMCFTRDTFLVQRDRIASLIFHLSMTCGCRVVYFTMF